MEEVHDLDIGDLVVLLYQNKLVDDISEVTGFVYKIKPKKLELSNYNPKTNTTWNTHYVTYSIDRILSYEVLKKSDMDLKNDSQERLKKWNQN